MLEYALNTSTNVFCQYCPRQEGLNRGAVLRRRCQSSWASPITILDRKKTSKRKHHVWWVEYFAFFKFFFSSSFFFIFRSVHGCVWMDVWVNVFTMPFLYADSGPWRKMSRAWSPMSAIMTSSGSTCPSHQESAWGTAEATLEGEKASDVGAVLRSICQASRPTPTGILDRKRTTKRRRHVWLVVGFALCFRSMHGWMGMDVWVNVFPLPFFCVDSGPWRKMSNAWSPIIRHHMPESPGVIVVLGTEVQKNKTKKKKKIRLLRKTQKKKKEKKKRNPTKKTKTKTKKSRKNI